MDYNLQLYITVNHTEQFGGVTRFRTGDKLILRKDYDNIYDDEAIAVFTLKNVKCGYVANSVDSVARGTYSSGRIYDKFNEEVEGIIRFILDEKMIVEVL